MLGPLGDDTTGLELIFHSFGIFQIVVAVVDFTNDFKAQELDPCLEIGIGFHALQEVDPDLSVFLFAFLEEFPGFLVFQFSGLFGELVAVVLVDLDAEIEEGIELFGEFLVGEGEGGGQDEAESEELFHSVDFESWILFFEIEGFDDFGGELFGAGGGVVDVGFPLDFSGVFLGEGVEVVDFDVLFFHNFGGDVVVDFGVTDDAALGALGDGGGISPDEAGAGLFESLDEFAEVFFVVSLGNLGFAGFGFGIGKVLAIGPHVFEVVEAPVKVDDVPFFSFAAGLEPFIELLKSGGGGSAVGEGPVDVGLALEHGTDVDGVSDGDGVTDEENAREAFDVGDGSHGFVCLLGESAGSKEGDEKGSSDHGGNFAFQWRHGKSALGSEERMKRWEYWVDREVQSWVRLPRASLIAGNPV